MEKAICVTELRGSLEEVIEEVAEEHIPYVLTRGDRPRAVLVPYEDFLRFRRLDEGQVVRRFQALRARLAKATADLTEEEVAVEVEAARAELGA
jgi:prevent-host-death family protein